ncbi:MAG: DNA internalization-related competence protein ComEC/Rec2 [Clostridiaceae bacterium]|nr:DNA internalization-related competence protein ComEC/Rec2 [Clostridiaceae bacterium]
MFKRRICWAASCYIAGVYLGQFMDMAYAIRAAFLMIIICVVKVLLSRKAAFLFPCFLSICMALGVLHFQTVVDTRQKPIAPFIDQPITFTCRIVADPILKENRIEYTADIYRIRLNKVFFSVKSKVKLICPLHEGNDSYGYGDVLNISSRLFFPSQSMNEGGFNYYYYLQSKGVDAICYAKPYQIEYADEEVPYNRLTEYAYYIRKSILDTIDSYLPQNEAAFLKGIMVGDRSGFSEKMKEDFSRSGIYHVVAVSGMHVSILLAGIMYFFGILRLNKFIIHGISIFFILQFILITGSTPSVLRAGIMACIFLLAFLVNREADSLTSLGLSAWVILLYNPLILFDAGFQLSYGATLSLLFFYKPLYTLLKQLPKGVGELAATSASAQLGTVIITAYHFNGISLVSIAGNLFVVPLIPIIFIMGFALYIMGNISSWLGTIIAGFEYVVLKLILAVTDLLGSIPFAVVRVPSPTPLVIAVYLLLLFMVYNVLQGKKKIATLNGFLLIVIIIGGLLISFFPTDNLEITFVNVGQGDCALIVSPGGRTVLIDGGGSEGMSSFDVGESIVIPYLLKRGIMHIDMAIISHYHDDHAEGIQTLFENKFIGTLLLPLRKEKTELMEKIIETARYNGVSMYYLSEGDHVKIGDGIYMQVLSPGPEQLEKAFENENNASVVLRLNYNKFSCLFTGDIEKEAEYALLQKKDVLKADVLKIPHHGSPTSSTEEFIGRVSPRYAVISVGKNSFGHPSEQVLQRLVEKGVRIYRTDVNGTITFITDGKRIRKIKVLREGE